MWRAVSPRFLTFIRSGVIFSDNRRVILLWGKSITNSSTWGTGVRCAAVHTAFFFFPKENAEPLAPHVTVNSLPAFFQKKNRQYGLSFESPDLNSTLANSNSLY